jgi:quinol monooxygenase YgiN
MEMPAPDASNELIEYLDQAGQSADDWYGISAALRQREQEQGDIQAGWLMTAFDYGLARRVGAKRRRSDAFSAQIEAGGMTYPTPIGQVPEEVVALWASTADRVQMPGPRARLHHLLFERGHGNKGTHGREAAAAYLALGTGSWDRLERANSLHWAVDLSKRIGDVQGAAKVYPALVALATESMDQERKEPGVALHALEVLAFDDSRNPELLRLLERAREVYGDDPFLTVHTIRIQEQVFKSDQAKREQLRQETVEAYIAHADKFPAGLMRMSFLEDAVKLANQYGLPDLADKATEELQQISIDDLGLKMISASAAIPAEVVDAHVAAFVERQSLGGVLKALASAEAPTGNIDRNVQSTQMIAKETPFASMIPTKHLGQDGLTRYTTTSESDRLDEQLSRIEIIGLGMSGEVTARKLAEALARFLPSEDDLTSMLQGLPHVSVSMARSLARALLDFQHESFEEATTVAMPRIESLVRALCQEKGVLRYRVQRDQKDGPSIRGQYPQLGALLVQLRPWMDRSWDRFLWTFLASPFGPNFRNELLHGYTEEVTRTHAALTILAALRLALVPVSSEPAIEDAGSTSSPSPG